MSERTISNYLYVHLYDAIILNRQRYPLYLQRTGGRSRLVSWALMTYEWLGLPVAKLIDRRAAKFHPHGIRVIGDDLIDMKETPAYGSLDATIKNKSFLTIDHKSLAKQITTSVKQSDFHHIVRITDDAINYIDRNNGTNSMLKHFLESVRRSAALMTIYRQQVTDQSLWQKLVKLEKQ